MRVPTFYNEEEGVGCFEKSITKSIDNTPNGRLGAGAFLTPTEGGQVGVRGQKQNENKGR